jgi:hypothetical protein
MRFGGGGGAINPEDGDMRFARAEEGIVDEGKDIMARWPGFHISGRQREEERRGWLVGFTK